MLNILKESYFNEYHASGFVETGMSLGSELVEEIKRHYLGKQDGHNDFPKFFVQNEHQAYMEGRALGFVLNAFPNLAKKMVKNFYDKAYKKAVYREQVFIEKVLNNLLENDFQRFFKTRYMVASYDMYLRNDHQCPPAGIHFDLPNFHHFYETENDLSIYIPLVDFDDTNGGGITVLPECKLKVPGNVLLKLLYEHFSKDPACVDGNGYVDPDRISPEAMAAFIKSAPHQALMTLYKSAIGLAKGHYAKEFYKPVETAGKVLLFNNKNFHAAEQWKNENLHREVYVIRMFPIYDVKIRLRKNLHGALFNNFLLDNERGEVRKFDDVVDFNRIADRDKLSL
jgi:ectoine hydroxylase-related dioxygenase (phytanoyl-CoA dioxygenase family)